MRVVTLVNNQSLVHPSDWYNYLYIGMAFNLRTVLAFVFGGVLLTGAFLLKPDRSITPAEGTSAEPTALRNFIPVQDSDNNGIPDWQEPFAADTINLSDLNKTTGVSTTTMTGQLVSSLADYLAGGDNDPADVLSLIGSELMTSAVDTQYSDTDIHIIDDNSPAALRAYGNQVALIANSYPLPANTKNELVILNDSFRDNDPETLKALDPIIASYEGMRDDMLELRVPSSLKREHLSLTNVYNALLIDIRGFRYVYEDALTSTLRFRRYPADREALQAAISNLYLKLHQSGIQWSDEDPASNFVEVRL